MEGHHARAIKSLLSCIYMTINKANCQALTLNILSVAWLKNGGLNIKSSVCGLASLGKLM